MVDATTRPNVPLAGGLYLGIEIGDREWKIASTVGLGQAPRQRTLKAGDIGALLEEIERAKHRFGLPTDAPIYSCYEAGRCGFWPHRKLLGVGIENIVVDSSSIEVNRRKRRAKSDKLDGEKLSLMLVRYCLGDVRTWKVVHSPSPEEEDLRQLHRGLIATKRDRTRARNRIKSLLATQGIQLKSLEGLPELLESCVGADGEPLLPGLKRRILCENEKVEFLTDQISRIDKVRLASLDSCRSEAHEIVRKLLQLKGIGIETAWLLTMEFFAWRTFNNVRQLGALAGLAPTPHQSGELNKELGITKAGNPLVRWILIESAWRWLRHQPESELSKWFERRYASGSKRQRKTGITALARKLLCALWKYVNQGIIPEGALLKS